MSCENKAKSEKKKQKRIKNNSEIMQQNAVKKKQGQFQCTKELDT